MATEVGRVGERVRPASLREARDVLLDSAADGAALLFRGGGTKVDWGAPPTRTDLVVETAGLDDLVAHDPSDMTATVGAGMPLERLQAALADSGQWLAVDPGEAGATVGGILAANAFGPRRLRYGAIRDNVIGVTAVLADGAVARSGGNVIKNVAGYDLPKLFCGSLGTLGLVAEVVLRLHPLPEARGTLRVEADADEATGLALALMASTAEPAALDWVGSPDGDGALWVRMEGHPPGVTAQLQMVEDMAAARGLASAWLENDEEEAAWGALVAASAGAEGETVAALATLPGQLPAVAGSLAEAAADAGVGATLHSHTALGLHSARFDASGAPAGHAAAVVEWRRRLQPIGATVTLRRHPRALDDLVDAWGLDADGPLARAVPLMRAVKLRLDPRGRCAPGRLLGGV